MNKVVLIGNLTKDPELTQTNSGISMCRMSIAVNRSFTNAQGEREADFFNIVAWRGLADNCQKFLKKGLKIAVSGSLQTRTYDSGDGNKKFFTDIVAEDIEFLSPRDSSSSGGQNEPHQNSSTPKKATIKDNPPIPDDELPF